MAVDARGADHEDVRARLSDALADRYDLEALVGVGGAAFVYRARDLRFDRLVAVKVLRPDRADALSTRRFLNELETSVRLEDPGIVQIFDSGEAAGLPFFVMPFYEGVESLEERLARVGAIPVDEALRIVRDVGEALAFAHEHGVLHRDVKPGNVLLVGGRALLTDFGVARALSAASTTSLTAQGLAVGTPAYMSPEQVAADSELDERSDQYSLACILHEMVAGSPVFQGESASAVARKHLALDPPRLATLRSDIPEPLDDAVFRALSKSPDDRFPSVLEFLHALDGMSGGVRVRIPAAVRVWGAALVAVGLAVITVFRSSSDADVAWRGMPASVAVMAFAAPGATEAERTLSVDLAERVERELNWWDSIRAVSGTTLSGEAHDMGLAGPPFESSEAALELARSASVQAVLRLSVSLHDDSAFVDGSLLDAASGTLVSTPVAASGRIEALGDLVDPVILALLNLEPGTELRRGTSSSRALAAEFEGSRALFQGRLVEADRHFRAALRHDSAWSVALHRLALTTYLRTAVEEGRDGWPVEEALPASARALERSGVQELSQRERMHAQGLYRFLAGDFAGSREVYASLLEAVPDDVLGLLMAGAVEWQDRTLVRSATGTLVPRADLNRALEAFRRTVELRPGFELGYVMVSQVDQFVQESIDTRACDVFTGHRDDPGSAEGLRVAREYRGFCPMMADSLEWVEFSEFNTLPAHLLQPGADRLFVQNRRLLERWASAAPRSAGARRALSESVLSERARARTTTPRHLSALAREALDLEHASLALKSDTAPADLVRLANLHLAAGEVSMATTIGRAALDRYEAVGEGAPIQLANVFIATGQASVIRDWVLPEPMESLVRNEAGEVLPDAGAREVWFRMRALAAAGTRGESLLRELARVDSLWDRAGYSPAQRRTLRASAADDIRICFALDPGLLDRWGDAGIDQDPILAAIARVAEGDPVSSEELGGLLRRAESSLTPAEGAVMLGMLAGKLGDPSLAIRLYSRLDSLPHRIREYDRGWGYHTLSLHLRALELERLTRLEEAAQFEQRFLGARPEPDPLTSGIRDEATALLARVNRR